MSLAMSSGGNSFGSSFMVCQVCKVHRVAPLVVEMEAFVRPGTQERVWRCSDCGKLCYVHVLWKQLRRFKLPGREREFVGPRLYDVRLLKSGGIDMEKAKMGIDRMAIDEDEGDEDDDDEEDDEDEDDEDPDDEDDDKVKKEEGEFSFYCCKIRLIKYCL